MREIALRRTAEHVEDDVRSYRIEKSIGTVWNTEGTLLVGIGPSAGSEQAVRSAARRAGQEVHLTPLEYRLLSVLMANAGRVLTHRQLLKEVWGPSHAEQSHYLRIYMGHLRQKLEVRPGAAQAPVDRNGCRLSAAGELI